MFAAGPKRAFRLLFNFCKFCETFTLKMFLVKKVKHEISILPWDSRYFCSVDNKHVCGEWFYSSFFIDCLY